MIYLERTYNVKIAKKHIETIFNDFCHMFNISLTLLRVPYAFKYSLFII